jgi:hypothetical protein
MVIAFYGHRAQLPYVCLSDFSKAQSLVEVRAQPGASTTGAK